MPKLAFQVQQDIESHEVAGCVFAGVYVTECLKFWGSSWFQSGNAKRRHEEEELQCCRVKVMGSGGYETESERGCGVDMVF